MFLVMSTGNYSLPNLTSFTSVFQWGNSVTDQFEGVAIDLVVFVIILFGSIIAGSEIEVAGFVSSFICIFLTLAMAIPKPAIINILFILPFSAGAMLCFLLIWTNGANKPYG